MTDPIRTETSVDHTATGAAVDPAAAPVHTHTTVIERDTGGGRSGPGLMTLVLLAVLIVGAFFAFQFMKQGEVRTDAVAGAAGEVGAAAQKVGDAAQDAAQKIGE